MGLIHLPYPPQSKPPIGSQIDWSHPLSKGLVGCWLMNEGGGNVITNLADFRKPISWAGTNWKILSSGIGLDFTGTLSKISYGTILGSRFNNLPTRGMTVVFRTKIDTFDATVRRIVSKRSTAGSTNGWSVTARSSTGNRISFEVITSTSANREGYVLDPGKNVTVAISYLHSATAVPKFYYDGINQAVTMVGTDANSYQDDTPTAFVIGNMDNLDRTFDGSLNYTYVYNRVLSPSEIQQLYAEPYSFIEQPRIWVSTTSISSNSSGHLLTSENLTLLQKHAITIADSGHLLTSENLTLLQKHAITIADSLHTLVSESITLTQKHIIVIPGAEHSVVSDNIILSFGVILSISDSRHIIESENILLVDSLTVQASIDGGAWQDLESHTGYEYPLDFLGVFKKIKFRIRHNVTATKQLIISGWEVETFPSKGIPAATLDSSVKVYANVDDTGWQELESPIGNEYPLDFLGRFKKIKFRIRHNATATQQLILTGYEVKTFPSKVRG